MYPPKPTKDPYVMVENMWSSLRRAADGHWGEDGRITPDADGYEVYMKLASKISPATWKRLPDTCGLTRAILIGK